MELKNVVEEIADVLISIDHKNAQIKDVLEVAKEEGLDVKLIKKLASLRAKDKYSSFRDETANICSTYEELFGEEV